jgi:anti-anti-sigma regulatory factor
VPTEADVLRLTQINGSQRVVLKAEGQLVAEWVPLLEVECKRLLAGNDRVVLDLANLTYADGRGIRVLRELRKSSLSIVHCTPLILGLLLEEGL